MKKPTIKIGSDFSGVGAFDYAIQRVANIKGFHVENLFACDMDKHVRKSYLANHTDPNHYPENVYQRNIPSESLDVYMTSPPCQSFSMAGMRFGKNDHRGILFFNSFEFIQANQPRFFIFENVEGLLSDNGGKTFSEWINLLGGKSINGLPILFPYESDHGNAANYHVYYQLISASDHGVPHNRRRIFIIGIRDDQDNNFNFPKSEHLQIKLFDVCEKTVGSKYFLSDHILKSYLAHTDKHKERGNGFKFIPFDKNRQCATTILTKYGQRPTDPYIFDSPNVLLFNNETDLFELYKDTVRRLTPRECFRLMDFPESFQFVVSDNQLYKQAGNSIVVRVLEKILLKLKI